MLVSYYTSFIYPSNMFIKGIFFIIRGMYYHVQAKTFMLH